MNTVGSVLRAVAVILVIFLIIFLIQRARADPLLYPYDPRVINPNDDVQMAAALTDPHIPSDIKTKLYLIWEKRRWPQEIVDPRDGSVWIYQAGHPPRRQD